MRTQDFPFTARPDDLNHDVFIARLSPGGELLSAIPFGGSGADLVYAIHLDSAGNLYLAGVTMAPDFPVTTRLGPPETTGVSFVLKLDPDGHVVYSTRFSGPAYITELAVDAEGQAHVLGNIPVPAHAGAWDMVIAKLSADGSHLLYSVQPGGPSYDIPQGLALDSAGNAHVAGYTSANFPPGPAPPGEWSCRTRRGRGAEAEPGWLPADLRHSPGWRRSRPEAIAIDPAGNALVYGDTSSTDFPVRNALQPQMNLADDWPYDTFLTRLDPAGALLDSTYFGGSADETATALAVDPAGFIYLLGESSSPDFPLRDPLPIDGLPIPTLYQRMGHVPRLDPRASEVLFSTFLDGTERELGLGLWDGARRRGERLCGRHERRFRISPGRAQPTHPPGQLRRLRRQDRSGAEPGTGPSTGLLCRDRHANRSGPLMAGWSRSRSVALPIRMAIRSASPSPRSSRTSRWRRRGSRTPPASAPRSRGSVPPGRAAATAASTHLTFTTTDLQGASCTGAVTVCVPHDHGKRSTCGDGGRLFDSVLARVAVHVLAD